MNITELCAGYAGLSMGIEMVLPGATLASAADNAPGPAKILACRYPGVRNLGDITSIDWSHEPVPVILAAGFPCQDVSGAGGRKGLRAGTRTGVWSHVARAIDALRPPLVFLENVAGLLNAGADSDMEHCPWCLGDTPPERAMRALGAVLGDLAEIGFDAVWACVPASAAGACHPRNRVFILGWPSSDPGCDPEHEADAHVHAAARRSGGAAADARLGALAARGERAAQERQPEPRDGSQRPALEDTDGAARGERRVAAPGQEEGGRAWADPCGRGGAPFDWGPYAAAVSRWEHAIGRAAPRPTAPTQWGERLSPRFVEFMMGLPDGWVTGVPKLSRRDQLRALGNGVVPQQAALAFSLLLPYAS